MSAHYARVSGDMGTSLPPLPLERNRDQISAWLGQVPAPVAIEIYATTEGIKSVCMLLQGKLKVQQVHGLR